MNNKETTRGHLGALISILIWGTTFVASKVLLRSFLPIEIMVVRTAIGTLALCIAKPKRLRLTERKHLWYFLGAGLTGTTLYYLLETLALTHTTASNVGVIVAVSPLFTAILGRILFKTRLRPTFFLGFVLAIGGICLISFSGGGGASVHLMGDLLCVLAALSWAVYSLFIRKIGTLGYDNVLVTRRVFCYGLLFMVPIALFMGFSPSLAALANGVNLANLIYLGIGASALCFVTWNFAVRALGNVKASVYIYAVPVVTTISSALILGETVTPVILLGIALTLAGLFISEFHFGQKKKDNQAA